MDVRCEKCKTEYELEDSRVTNKGVTVKCTQCGHLFRVRRRAGTGVTEAPTNKNGAETKGRKKTVPGRFAGAKPKRQIPDLNVGGSQTREPQESAEKKAASDNTAGEKAAKGQGQTEEQPAAKRWLIRRTSGEVFQFKELTTLQQWIVEEKVDREDEISKSGKAWEKLGAIEELKSFFTVVDQARQARLVKAKSESGQDKNQRAQKSDKPAIDKKLEDKENVDLATAPTLPPDKKSGEKKTSERNGANETHPTEDERPTKKDSTAPETLSAEQQDDAEEEDIPTAEMKKGRESAAYEMGSGVFKEDVEGPSEMGKLTSGDKEPGRTAAWEKEGFRVSKKVVEPTAEISISEREALQRPGSGAMKVIAVVVIGAIIGLAAVIGIWKWDKIVDLLAGEEDKATDKYSHARALVLKDTEESLSRAKEIFRVVYGAKKSAEARAGQAKVAALQALYRKWKADSLEEKAQRIVQKRANTGHVSKTATNGEKESKNPNLSKKPEPAKKPLKDAPKHAKIPDLTPSPEAAALRKKAAETRGEAAVWAKEALGHARAAYDIKKSSLTSRILALSLLAAGRDSAEAKKHLQYALNEQGNDPNTLYVKAVLESTEEKWSEARQSLRQAIAIHRKQSTKIMYRAHYLMARLSLKLKEPGKAKNELQSILATNKNHRQAEDLLKFITEEDSSPEEEAVAEQTADAGVESVDAGKGDTAETPEEPSTDKALVGDYDTLVRKGDRFSETGRVDDAVRAYNQALQQKPSGVEALTGLAYCHLDKGRSAKAKSTFRKVLSLSAGHGEALIGMAEIYKKESNWKNSMEYFKRYLNYHPGGRRSGLAQRNLKELEERIEREKPREISKPEEEEAAPPDKGDAETKEPRPESKKVVIPPSEKEPAEPRPDTKPSTEDKKDAPSPRPRASSGDKPDTRENPPTNED